MAWILVALQRFCIPLLPCLCYWLTIRLRDGNEWALFVPRRSLQCMPIAHLLSGARLDVINSPAG